MRQSKIRKYIPKYMKRKAKRVNRIINMWDNAGLSTNDLEVAKDLLSDFYADIGKTVVDTEKASERIKLSRSEKEEYNKILDYILYNDDLDLSRRTLKNQQIRSSWNDVNASTYEKVKDQYDQVYDEQSFINFVDRMNKTKNNRVLSSIFDSDQIARLYSIGFNNQMKETEINRLVIQTYEETGKTYDALLEEIIDLIEGD